MVDAAVIVGESKVEWLGDIELRRDGFVIPLDKVLPGPLEVCAQSYPVGAATRATLHWTSANGEPRETAMTIESDDAGPFEHNTRWCAQLDVGARELALSVRAEDDAGAAVHADVVVTPRIEIDLFETAEDLATWRMAGLGSFANAGDTLRAQPGPGLGLLWSAIPTPADFTLSFDTMLDRFDDNSGAFIRFRDPETFGYNNTAWVGVHDGLEIQIDETARPDGADVHRTGAVYEQPSTFTRAPDGVPGTWRRFEITVSGMHVVVRIDGTVTADLTFSGDPARPDRARPSKPGAPRFIGLQSHTGAVAFRHVRLRAL